MAWKPRNLWWLNPQGSWCATSALENAAFLHRNSPGRAGGGSFCRAQSYVFFLNCVLLLVEFWFCEFELQYSFDQTSASPTPTSAKSASRTGRVFQQHTAQIQDLPPNLVMSSHDGFSLALDSLARERPRLSKRGYVHKNTKRYEVLH